VLALQETKLVDEKFLRAEIEAAGYQLVYAKRKVWLRVATVSNSVRIQPVDATDWLNRSAGVS